MCGHSNDLEPFVEKDHPLSSEFAFHLCNNQKRIFVWVYFWFSIMPHWSVSKFLPVPQWLLWLYGKPWNWACASCNSVLSQNSFWLFLFLCFPRLILELGCWCLPKILLACWLGRHRIYGLILDRVNIVTTLNLLIMNLVYVSLYFGLSFLPSAFYSFSIQILHTLC